MNETSSDFRDALLELIDTSPEPMDHPSPDQWIAYHRGELPAEEEARLQEHLARCRDCFDLADGAAAFAEPDEEPNASQDVADAALWRLLRPQLEPSSPSVPPPLDNVREISAGPRRRQPFWGQRLSSGLAAALFVAVVGLAGWDVRQQRENVRQQREIDALSAPQTEMATLNFSGGERNAAPPASAEQTLSASKEPWVLAFHPGDDLPVYWLSLREESTGKELGPFKMRPNRELALTLHLPEGLPPGRYRLELSDDSGGHAGKVLETYLLRVTEPGGGD
jgi:hypothetical protein